MPAHWEPLTPDTLNLCVPLWADRGAYTQQEFDTAMIAVSTLLDQRRAFGAVVFEGREACAFGLTAFVREDALNPLLVTAQPQLGKRLLLRAPPLVDTAILDRDQIARGNRESGLHLVVLNTNYNARVRDRGAILGCIMASFQVVHQGYRIARIINEVLGHCVEDVLASDTYEILYRHREVGDVPGLPSIVASLTSTQATEKRTPLLGMFVYSPPRVLFTDSEQQLLRVALSGAPDAALAAKLGIPVTAVKSRWRRLQERACRRIPELFQHLNAAPDTGRGQQSRHLLLDYVRRHPSELTPYAAERAPE